MNWKGKIYWTLTWVMSGLALLCSLPFMGLGHCISYVGERWVKSDWVANVGTALVLPAAIIMLLMTGMAKEDLPEWAKKTSSESKKRYTKRL